MTSVISEVETHPASFVDCVRAEWFGLRRRPGVLVMALVWSIQVMAFAYLILFIVYRSTGSDLAPADAEGMLGQLLPHSTGSFIVGSLPIYGGPVMLVIGVMVASGDYRLGTMRTLLSRFSNRTVFLAARFTGLVLVMLALSVLTMVLSLLSSGLVALAEDRPLDYPAPGSLLLAIGSIWLIVTAWASLGFALGSLTRNVGAAIAIGLTWTLGIETLLVGGIASVVPFLDAIRVVMLSPSSGSLASALGAQDGSGGTPGVVSTVDGPVAAIVLVGWTAISALVALAAFRRRDVV